MSLDLTINGEGRTVPEDLTVAELVRQEAGDEYDHVAVALNDEIISRSTWDEVCLEPGDDVEIVQPIQGGC